jgi:hypothetical protein
MLETLCLHLNVLSFSRCSYPEWLTEARAQQQIFQLVGLRIRTSDLLVTDPMLGYLPPCCHPESHLFIYYSCGKKYCDTGLITALTLAIFCYVLKCIRCIKIPSNLHTISHNDKASCFLWSSLRCFYILIGVYLWSIQLMEHDLERHIHLSIQKVKNQANEVKGIVCRVMRQWCPSFLNGRSLEPPRLFQELAARPNWAMRGEGPWSGRWPRTRHSDRVLEVLCGDGSTFQKDNHFCSTP